MWSFASLSEKATALAAQAKEHASVLATQASEGATILAAQAKEQAAAVHSAALEQMSALDASESGASGSASPVPSWRPVSAAGTPGGEPEGGAASKLQHGGGDALNDAAVRVGDFFRGALDFNSMRDEQETNETSVCYVWERLIAMPFPKTIMDSKGGNNGRAVAKYFREKFGPKRTMVWNLTENEYDAELFDGNVVQHSFEGHASPPLGLLVKIVLAVENWIASDGAHAAAVHCTSGRGRTVLVCACVLAWLGIAPSVEEALRGIEAQMGLRAAKLLVPSQRRYMRYFGNVLDGARPGAAPLLLQAITISGVPRFTEGEGDAELIGCRPYVTIVQCTRRVYATPMKSVADAAFFPTALGGAAAQDTMRFGELNLPLVGDIVVSLQHLQLLPKKRKRSVWKCSFHSGYVHGNSLLFPMSELDTAARGRFPESGFVGASTPRFVLFVFLFDASLCFV